MIELEEKATATNPLRIGLMGFGKTGRAVATVLLKDPGLRLEWVIRKSHKLEHRSVPEFLGIESPEPGLIYTAEEFSAAQLFDHHPVDAIIDFSSEEGLSFYGDEAAQRGITIVTAISSYESKKIHELERLSKKTRVLWSPNITVGINFMILAARTLRLITPETDVEIVEEHFKDKREISGTAKKIAQSLEVEEDNIKSIRAGGIIGTHEILFGFPFQTVRLKHESISREAFGNGARFAVRELIKRDPGMYTMEEMLGPYFLESNEKFQLNSEVIERPIGVEAIALMKRAYRKMLSALRAE